MTPQIEITAATSQRYLLVDSEMGWRGGQAQTLALAEGLSAAGHATWIAAPEGSALARAYGESGRVIALPSGGHALRQARQLMAACKRENISVIDAQSSKAHGWCLLAKMMGLPVALVIHRRMGRKGGVPLVGRWKYLSRHIAKYVAISSWVKQSLITAGVAPGRIALIPSGIDTTKYQGQDRTAARKDLIRFLGIDPSVPLVGIACALTREKDVATFVRMASILKGRGMKAHFVIAGDGPLRTDLEKARAKMELDYDLSFLGFVEDMPRVLLALDVLVLTSHQEALGSILLDGLMAGCGVVASNIGGIGDIIHHDQTGLLAKAGDASSFADGVSLLLSQPDLRHKLVVRGQELVKERFSLAAIVTEHIRTFASVAK